MKKIFGYVLTVLLFVTALTGCDKSDAFDGYGTYAPGKCLYIALADSAPEVTSASRQKNTVEAGKDMFKVASEDGDDTLEDVRYEKGSLKDEATEPLKQGGFDLGQYKKTVFYDVLTGGAKSRYMLCEADDKLLLIEFYKPSHDIVWGVYELDKKD